MFLCRKTVASERKELRLHSAHLKKSKNSLDNEMKLLVADDHLLLRDAIAEMLKESGFEIQLAATYDDVTRMIEKHGPFDIVLLDLNMPDGTGIPSIAKVIEINAPCPVVLFSGNPSYAVISQALEIGVKGFIPKSISLVGLEKSLKLIAAGEIFVPYGILDSLDSKFSNAPTSANGTPVLSSRELRVLGYVSVGLSNKEIAHNLGLSEVTIKMHMRSICSKLGAKNRTQAAIIAKHEGIV